MHLTTLIALAAPALAFPYTTITNTISILNSTCSTQAFQVIGFETFTVAPGPRQPSTPEAFGASHLSFLFIDPNFGHPGSCIRSLAAGAGGSVADPENYYFCVGNPSLEFKFDGKMLSLRHSFDCNMEDITTGGSKNIKGSLKCFKAFNGTSCISRVGDIEVPATEIDA